LKVKEEVRKHSAFEDRHQPLKWKTCGQSD